MSALTYGLETPSDLLAKLKRDAALLKDEVTSDRFFNFVVTGYSLIDWVKECSAVPAAAQAEAQKMYTDPWIQVCGDIATASKHFRLTQRTPITSKAEAVEYGWGLRWDGAWGLAGPGVRIELNDGTFYSHVTFIENVVKTWQSFFETHHMEAARPMKKQRGCQSSTDPEDSRGAREEEKRGRSHS